MMVKLRKCPFCGGEAKIEIRFESFPMDGCCKDWLIRCTKCSCSIRLAADSYYGRKFNSEEEAIAAWNRRADDGNNDN